MKKNLYNWRWKRFVTITICLVLLVCAVSGLSGCGRKRAETVPAATGSASSLSGAESTTPEPTSEESAPEAESTSSVSAVESATPEPTPEESVPETESTSSVSAFESTTPEPTSEEIGPLREDGEYTGKDEVAAYIHIYGHLPPNYITKKDAENLGWVSNKGNLWEVAPGKSIGGSKFGNYEGNLPEAKGRKYYECDIDYEGGYRGAKRIVFSNDGLVFYTEDHYETFEQLY